MRTDESVNESLDTVRASKMMLMKTLSSLQAISSSIYPKLRSKAMNVQIEYSEPGKVSGLFRPQVCRRRIISCFTDAEK